MYVIITIFRDYNVKINCEISFFEKYKNKIDWLNKENNFCLISGIRKALIKRKNPKIIFYEVHKMGNISRF